MNSKVFGVLVLGLASFNSLAQDDNKALALLDGRWHCEGGIEEDDIKMTIESNEIIFGLSKRYESDSDTKIIYHGEEVTHLKIKEYGHFTLVDGKITFEIDDMAIVALLDKHNSYSTFALSQLKTEMLEDKNVYQVITLNKDLWRVKDVVNENELNCIKPEPDLAFETVYEN